MHTFSLLSSSFVEEEHQTWYYLTVTLFFLMLFTMIKDGAQEQILLQSSSLKEGDTSKLYHQREPQSPVCKSFDSNKFMTIIRSRHFVMLILMMALCRIARSWNRTGDKWAHLPDVGDWLVE